MDHIAIMKKEWGFLEKILSGQKTIESRWSLAKRAPWNAVKKGDAVYFKNSSGLVLIKAGVKKVIQFSSLNPSKVKQILQEYGKDIGIKKGKAPAFYNMFTKKKYCVLIFLKNPKKVKPFQINKKGFAPMGSWITVGNIKSIEK